MSDPPDTPAERVSRFREHTNTNSSIRPPPDELWKDLGIDGLLDRFHYENESTPAVRREGHPRVIMERGVQSLGGGGVAAAGERGFMEGRKIATPRKKGTASAAAAKRKGSDAAATVATAEGTFGRFSRVFANVFSGVLGKRKATSDADHDAASAPPIDPQQELLDERKRAAEEAYHLAKAQGLLPAPKVFVRPGMANRAWSADMPENLSLHDRAATDRPSSRALGTPSSKPRPPLTPRTPGSVAKSPSKADLNKQKRLSKRVSSLEVKLASAKKELASVLGNDCFPAVPSLPAQYTLSAAEGTRDVASPLFSDDAPMLSPTLPHGETATAKADSAPLPAKLTKKRKTTRSKPVDADADVDVDVDADPDFHPTILSDSDADAPHPHRSRSLKRVKSETSKRLKRTSSRLSRRRSQGSMKDADEEEEVVVVVKPGGAVPPVPLLPAGVEGRKVPVEGDDGYGGLGHEIF